uniref:2,3-bisphosphoglycerate-dependent phosphoglycerate mutase n=1 Tax=Neobacillus citreus TaxID=2833578 RepID=A0A942SXU9_9BACI
MTGAMVLLRHGESTANQAGIFTGLLDVPLTARGEEQARQAGRLLTAHGVMPDLIVTSTLQRALHTADLVSDVLGRDIPTTAVWEFNERNYGALTGMTKAAACAALGDASTCGCAVPETADQRRCHSGRGSSCGRAQRCGGCRGWRSGGRNPSPTSSSASSRSCTTGFCPRWRRGRRCWSSRTGTRCEPSAHALMT